MQSGEEKISLIRNRTEYYVVLQIIGDEIIALQGVMYSIFALKLIRKYRLKRKDYESIVDKNIVKVLYLGIAVILLSWIIAIVGIHLEYLNIDTTVDLYAYTYLLLVIVIYTISYFAIKSPEIFKLDIEQIQVASLKNQNQEIKSKSQDPLPDPALEDINNRLTDYMANEKPYLNPELSLKELADQIGEKRYLLSMVINHKHNKNFFEFINEYRINEVKSNMKDLKNKHLKIISIAYDSGFNSSASFYRIFKQMTNMTPSKYISSYKAEQAGD